MISIVNRYGKQVRVIIQPMTLEEARKVLARRPFSKYAETRFGGNSLADDACLLINGSARRCTMCQAPTINEYLEKGICPDCDGRTEYNGGVSPFVKD